MGLDTTLSCSNPRWNDGGGSSRYQVQLGFTLIGTEILSVPIPVDPCRGFWGEGEGTTSMGVWEYVHEIHKLRRIALDGLFILVACQPPRGRPSRP
jgi:hypothetical protein